MTVFRVQRIKVPRFNDGNLSEISKRNYPPLFKGAVY